MALATRRSRRAIQKTLSAYEVGDIVEIIRTNKETAIGRLAYKLTDSSTVNPRWLVTLDSPNAKSEEVYEHDIRKVSKYEASTPTETPLKSSLRVPTTNIKTDRKNKRNDSPSIISDDTDQPTRKKAKHVSFSEACASDDSTVATGTASIQERLLSRAERSHRRHARMDKTAALGRRGRKRVDKDIKQHHGLNEEVVKVQLLTGTLYMYRGVNRRAEFVRHV